MSTQLPTESSIKRIVYISVLIAIGVVLNLIEPPQIYPFIPGAKLGLANLSTLLAMMLFGAKYGIIVAAIRTIVASIFRGSINWISFGTSFFGGISAAIVMAILFLFSKNRISIKGISTVGGITNNIVQVIFVYIVTKNTLFLYYVFFLIPIGGLAGFLIGVLGVAIYNRLEKR